MLVPCWHRGIPPLFFYHTIQLVGGLVLGFGGVGDLGRPRDSGIQRKGLIQPGLGVSMKDRPDKRSGQEVLDHRIGAPNWLDTMLGQG